MSALESLLGALEQTATKRYKGPKRESALRALTDLRDEFEQMRSSVVGPQGPAGPLGPKITEDDPLWDPYTMGDRSGPFQMWFDPNLRLDTSMIEDRRSSSDQRINADIDPRVGWLRRQRRGQWNMR